MTTHIYSHLYIGICMEPSCKFASTRRWNEAQRAVKYYISYR